MFCFFQLDSDQESTDGEDSVTQSGEPLGVLEPNRLLFRASRVHNVPLMCQAIALGKNYLLRLSLIPDQWEADNLVLTNMVFYSQIDCFFELSEYITYL